MYDEEITKQYNEIFSEDRNIHKSIENQLGSFNKN